VADQMMTGARSEPPPAQCPAEPIARTDHIIISRVKVFCKLLQVLQLKSWNILHLLHFKISQLIHFSPTNLPFKIMRDSWEIENLKKKLSKEPKKIF